MQHTDISFRDRAVYLHDADAIVLADLHLGRSRTAPVDTPLDEAVRLADRIVALTQDFKASHVIIAGDVLDAFDVIPPGVTERFRDVEARLAERDVTLTLLRGNHDPVLSSLYDGEILDEIELDGTVICHGHALPDGSVDRVVLGHEHPAIRIEGVKHPCYLLGHGVFRGADVLVVPAFSPLIRGTVMNGRTSSECHSPVVRATDLDRYRPIVLDGDTSTPLTFPPLGSLRRYL